MFGQYSPYAAGRKVYTNGSHAPTRGTVDPRGYIQRELRNRAARPAQPASQTRSGLAQAALARMSSAAPVWGSSPSSSSLSPLTQQRVKPKNLTATVKLGGNKKKKKKPNRPTGNTPPQVSNPPVPSPYISINSNGQLDLPYNPAYGWEVLQGTQQMNQQLMDLQLQQQQQAMEYSQSKRQGDIDYQKLSRETLARNAGRGMAFSSGHANDVSDNATNYNNYMTDLDSRNTQFNQGVQMSRTQIEAAFNEMLRQAGLQYAQQLEEQAGTLGYGKSETKQNKKDKPPAKGKKKTPPKKKAPKKQISKGGPKR